MQTFIDNLIFVFQRLTWTSVVDILLVAFIFFVILVWLQDTQAITLINGVVILLVVSSLLTSLINLPAFTWLVRTATPALVLAIPVIFAPEIRQALERLGRAGSWFVQETRETHSVIPAIVDAAARLASRRHGALIVLQRFTNLGEYIETGVPMDALVTAELLLQIFYPKTPLHDGAVIIQNGRIKAAACVLPLSASGVLSRSPDRQMGLRHRAALGISEVSDAVVVVVSEETGTISLTVRGRILRRLSPQRLEQILYTLFRPPEDTGIRGQIRRWMGKGPSHPGRSSSGEEEPRAEKDAP